MVVNTLRAAISAERTEVASLHYASPQPLPENQMLRRADELMAAWKAED